MKASELYSDTLYLQCYSVLYVGLSTQQIHCHYNRRGPREERVYGYSDWTAVKSGAIEKQGVFVYCLADRTALFLHSSVNSFSMCFCLPCMENTYITVIISFVYVCVYV